MPAGIARVSRCVWNRVFPANFRHLAIAEELTGKTSINWKAHDLVSVPLDSLTLLAHLPSTFRQSV